ncbi:hypothetical protein C8J56DRAFT_1170807 [Mycena floridula]|nr:hypothetical protein C8J56DRAFT_1170807 [Mycena floridula]
MLSFTKVSVLVAVFLAALGAIGANADIIAWSGDACNGAEGLNRVVHKFQSPPDASSSQTATSSFRMRFLIILHDAQARAIHYGLEYVANSNLFEPIQTYLGP